jgi:hypothetical protein
MNNARLAQTLRTRTQHLTMQLEQLQTNAAIRGILPDALVTVVSVQWFGSEALELTYKTPTGKVANESGQALAQ